MATTIGMGVKKKTSGKEDKEIKKLEAKIAELEKENTNLIKTVENLNKEKEGLEAKVKELEKPSNN